MPETPPIPISACVIAKNEADRIGPCLVSLAFCDEIVVLDSGSTDGTPDLCRAAGARVIETDWPGWMVQKNRAAAAATYDWILSLDADERVDEALRASIERLRSERLGQDDAPRAWEVKRKVRYLGRWLKHGGWYPEWRIRLYHRAHARWGGSDLHETVIADGPVDRIREGDLEHHTYRSISDHIERINGYTTLAAAQLLKDGKRGSLWPVLLRPPYHFATHYLVRLGFLDGWAGLAMCSFRAWYVFLKYAKAWELARRARASTGEESS